MTEQETIITPLTVLKNPNWELVSALYADDYLVFREIGIKEKQTIWLHVHDGWSGVFINEHQFLRLINTWEHLSKIISVLRDELD